VKVVIRQDQYINNIFKIAVAVMYIFWSYLIHR
jgi:hypothetical protein